jgi:hypothetical protein
VALLPNRWKRLATATGSWMQFRLCRRTTEVATNRLAGNVASLWKIVSALAEAF